MDAEILSQIVGWAGSDPSRAHLASLAGAFQYRLVYRLARRYFPAGTRVLDWGAGWGHFSYFLCRAGYQATGYSFDEFSFRPWVEGMPYTFVQAAGDPVRLPFPDESFDGVASIGVLEHVRDTGGTEEGSLAEIRRVLRPGGTFLCAHLPNWASWIEFVGSRIPGIRCHDLKFTGPQIRRLVAGAGLSLTSVGLYGALPHNSLGRMPGFLRKSRLLASVYGGLDEALRMAVPALCQNWYFVATKRS